MRTRAPLVEVVDHLEVVAERCPGEGLLLRPGSHTGRPKRRLRFGCDWFVAIPTVRTEELWHSFQIFDLPLEVVVFPHVFPHMYQLHLLLHW